MITKDKLKSIFGIIWSIVLIFVYLMSIVSIVYGYVIHEPCKMILGFGTIVFFEIQENNNLFNKWSTICNDLINILKERI